MPQMVPGQVSAEYEKPKAQLSCLQCQRRKKKCDKRSPCQACQQAGIACTAISRARLPRGRHGAQRSNGSGDLQLRVARLEELLSSQKAGRERVDFVPSGPHPTVADSTWASINEQVVGIRELVDSLAGDDPVTESPEPDRIQRFDILLYGDTSCYVQPYVLELPSEDVISELVEVYLYRVDPVFKVVHASSLRALFEAGVSITPSQELLKFAVLFAAVNSLNDQDYSQRFNSNKEVLNERLKLAVEVLLSRARILTTTSLTVLQAFVIYLAALRTSRNHRSVCVLLATAIRIGQSLGLDLPKTNHMPYETEIRRLVWFSIGILDLQSTFHVGSYSAQAGGAILNIPPLHVDDADLSPSNATPPRVRYAFTDMTVCSASHLMLRFMRKMIHTPMDVDGRPVMQQNWQQRHAIVEECARALDEHCLRYCDTIDPFQCFTRLVCETMIVTLRLLVRRPMYRLYNPEPLPEDDFNVLDVATDVLEQTLRKFDNPQFQPWEWFAWAKWYALAVALAEFCEHTEGPRIDRAWSIVEVSFPKIKHMLSDNLLWTAIEKLMWKAQCARHLKKAAAGTVDDAAGIATSPLPLELSGPPSLSLKFQALKTDELEVVGQEEYAWQDIDMEPLSWVNWESFVQDLGDPAQQDIVYQFD